ncbi:MAG: DUF2959 domain-containing protein [Deltaproteobacteria bacterium HGW-Deltaproteobacteria-21]|nr:MAG: DUF2959 domain-containing protein [Deltaproteobacteria bacterium HGW-Deltaproteobacteria-21]
MVFGKIVIACLYMCLITACQTTYYAAWEKLGKEKRHLLRDNVEKARSEQQEAAEQFKDALTRMKEMYGFKGGELEEVYNKIKADYEESEEQATAVRKRIGNVQQIAGDLFKEWEAEIQQISDQGLREKSRASLKTSRQNYSRLERAMKRAEASMTPVLKRHQDQVLYLKHNLNAQAIGSLKQEVGAIEADVQKLILEMEKSIKEADLFLKSFEG